MENQIWKPILCRHCNQPGYNFKQPIHVIFRHGENELDWYEHNIRVPLCQMCVSIHKKFGMTMYECNCNISYYRELRQHSKQCDQIGWGYIINLNTEWHEEFMCNFGFVGRLSEYKSQSIVEKAFAKFVPIQSILEPAQRMYLAREEFIRISSDLNFMFHILPAEIQLYILEFINKLLMG